jgi:hypothetical protein
MLLAANDLKGLNLEAKDGHIGQGEDVYFDDSDWTARYLVVYTGSWLSGRRVLISPHSLGSPDMVRRALPVGLTRAQIQDAPGAETSRKTRRQIERLDEGARGSTHLRSAAEVRGYHVEAVDGDIGHIEDFLLDEDDWSIRYLAIDTRNWLPGRHVAVPVEWAGDIRWEDRKVAVRHPREEIRGAPEYSGIGYVTPEYSRALEDYFEPSPRRT